MSKYTDVYLNGGNILVGHDVIPWWFDANLVDMLNDESPLYPEAIPVADVMRRLFPWLAVSRRVAVERPCSIEEMDHFDADDRPARWVVQGDRQAIVRDDTEHVFELFKAGYQPHQYGESLIGAVSNIIGGTVGIETAGVLAQGGIAWVHVSTPETVTNPQGVAFRPRLLATTSFDGSIATTWKRTFHLAVCDNTREMCLGESGAVFRLKHTRHSKLRIKDARAALGFLQEAADEFSAEIAELCATTVTDAQWFKFLDTTTPLVDEKGENLTGRALTMATKKQEELRGLWLHDNRVSPWKNTAFGVVQAGNTWRQHFQTIRGAGRVERNMTNEIKGQTAKADNEDLDVLARILTNA